MFKSLKLLLFVLPLTFTFTSLIYAEENPDDLTPEEEWMITDRDRGSREKPTLYYYNKQNVRYNRRYNEDQNRYNRQRSDYYYNQPSSQDTFNRSYYDDNTSPNLYLNR